MKKIFTLVFALSLALCLSLAPLAVSAEETDTPIAENATGGEISPPAETEEPKALFDGWIEKITDSTLWISLGTYALGLIGIFGLLKSKFGSIASLIKDKADGETIAKAFKEAKEEITKEFRKEISELSAKLSEYQDNETKMWAIITIFMTHARISPSVKVEIMNRLTGIKETAGSLSDIIKEADEAIKSAESEAKEQAPETPALDSILKETDSSYMVL